VWDFPTFSTVQQVHRDFSRTPYFYVAGPARPPPTPRANSLRTADWTSQNIQNGLFKVPLSCILLCTLLRMLLLTGRSCKVKTRIAVSQRHRLSCLQYDYCIVRAKQVTIFVLITFVFRMLTSQHFIFIIFLPMAQQPLVGLGLLIIEASRSHSVRHTTLGRTPLDE
jgi:hypothetical protein